MPDLYHMWGNDLVIAPGGDLSVIGGHTPDDSPTLTIQRLLRRLLTNPGEYIWHPGYGAGLARFLGQPINVPALTAIIRAQILQEAAVAQNPPPRITLDGRADGTVNCHIVYTDAVTGKPVPLSFSISA